MYPDISPKLASRLNQLASTVAGLIFGATYIFLFDSSPVIVAVPLIVGMLIDSSTVPFVHSGVISERYNSLKHSDLFIKIHVPPAALAYGSMLLFIGLNFAGYRINQLFYLFIACWLVVYVTGLMAFIQISRKVYKN